MSVLLLYLVQDVVSSLGAPSQYFYKSEDKVMKCVCSNV